MMEALRKAIEEQGVGLEKSIVKVDSFLNHRIDVALSTEMGRALAAAFAEDHVELVLTAEASGIAVALTTAQALGNVPLVFAKKGDPLNVGPNVYTANVFSFTKQVMNTIRVDRSYLPEGTRVLIVDDFMANGEAVEGLRKLVMQAHCTLVGVGICVEKGFQPGGDRLRAAGIKYVPLAVVDAIEDGRIVLREM